MRRRTAALLAMPQRMQRDHGAAVHRVERRQGDHLVAREAAGAERFGASRPVDHVTVHAMPGDSSVPTAHYLLVLWHVPEFTPAR